MRKLKICLVWVLVTIAVGLGLASVAYSLLRMLVIFMQRPLQVFDIEAFNLAYEQLGVYGVTYIVAGVVAIILGLRLWNGQAKTRNRK